MKQTDDYRWFIPYTACRASQKALFIAIVVISINEFSGAFILVSYTATIFSNSGSILSPNLSAVIVGLIQFIGTYISTIYVEKAGRKVFFFFLQKCSFLHKLNEEVLTTIS